MGDETGYDFSGINLDDAQDYEAVPAGEYQVEVGEIIKVRDDEYKYIQMRLDILGQEGFVKGIFHTQWLPDPAMKDGNGEDKRKWNNAALQLRNFCAAMGISGDELNGGPDNFVGKMGYAHLKVTQDEKYGEQNEVEKWQLPR